MCYGSVDPKYVARDIEARVKPLSLAEVPEKEGQPEVPGRAIGWIRALWVRIRRKEGYHVA
jgi:hypothetical protein